jgi:hypothetical protein
MDTGSHNRRWAIGLGVVLGASAAVALYPLARSTAAAQVGVALGQRPEWLRAASGGWGRQLERRLAAAADKVDLQVAGATLLRAESEGATPDEEVVPFQALDRSTEVLARLDALARRFPSDPSLRAHQLRYLAQSAVWLKRPEQSLRPGQPLPSAAGLPSRRPSAEALARFAAAAAEGQRLEPGNAFFDQMRAAAAFIEGQDDPALGDLHAAAAKPYWNDYAAEEVQGQWHLLRAVYGSRGAFQKLPSSLSFLFPHSPHVELLRGVAQMTRWHVAQREHAGDLAAARRIRGDLMRMGAQIADGSPLPIGKPAGVEIFDLGWKPVPEPNADPPRMPSTLEEDRERKARRERYAASLDQGGQPDQAAWVRSEGERVDHLRVRVRSLQADDFFLRSLLWLGICWKLGPVLLRQMLALLVLWGIAIGLGRLRSSRAGAPGTAATAAPWPVLKWYVWLAIYLALVLAPLASLTPVWSNNLLSGVSDQLFVAALFLGLTLTGLFALAHRRGRRAPAAHEVRPRVGMGPRWQPALVAAVCVLPSAALLPLVWEAIRSGSGRALPSPAAEVAAAIQSVATVMVGLMLFSEPVRGVEVIPDLGIGVLTPAVLPAALLAFLVLCRVAALGLPLRTGLARGVRRAAPYAVALMAALYLASLVPTIAADRALDQHLNQMLVEAPGTSTPRIR